MRFLKNKKSGQSISDLDGFTDISCKAELSICIAGCSGPRSYSGERRVSGMGQKQKPTYGFFGLGATDLASKYYPEYANSQRDSEFMTAWDMSKRAPGYGN